MESHTDKRLIEVPHVQQALSWDCGLACVRMLAELYHLVIDFDEACKKLEIDTSVWTIDLAYILTDCGIKAGFYTITPGVNKDYANQPFYKSTFNVDEERVEKLFGKAQDCGVSVTTGTMSSMDIARHIVDYGGLAIALIDLNHLFCDTCSRTCMLWDTAMTLMLQCGASYQGHFILICGVDIGKARFYYRNPALKESLCTCSFESMDKARFQPGTDEDILLVYPPDNPPITTIA